MAATVLAASFKQPQSELVTMSVTPWDVTGRVDYDKIVEQFGCKAIDSALVDRMPSENVSIELTGLRV